MHFFDTERSRVSNANTSRHFRSLELANNGGVASLTRVEPYYSARSAYFPKRFEKSVKKNRNCFLNYFVRTFRKSGYGNAPVVTEGPGELFSRFPPS